MIIMKIIMKKWKYFPKFKTIIIKKKIFTKIYFLKMINTIMVKKLKNTHLIHISHQLIIVPLMILKINIYFLNAPKKKIIQ